MEWWCLDGIECGEKIWGKQGQLGGGGGGGGMVALGIVE